MQARYAEPHQAPARPAHTSERPQPAGGETPAGSHTRARTPRPSASASDAQEPEPNPAKQADEDGDGTRPPAPRAGAGHARPGADTQSAEDPAPATRRTTAVDRRAKLPRPRPKREARKTRADGSARATRSMPDAQPVTTVAPGASWPTAHVTARRQPGAAARLPETPTTRADWRTPATAETEEGAGMASRASEGGAPNWGATPPAEARRRRAQSGSKATARRLSAGPPRATRRGAQAGGASMARTEREPASRAECPLRDPRACPSVWQPPSPGAPVAAHAHRSVRTTSPLLTPPLSARSSATPCRGPARHVHVLQNPLLRRRCRERLWRGGGRDSAARGAATGGGVKAAPRGHPRARPRAEPERADTRAGSPDRREARPRREPDARSAAKGGRERRPRRGEGPSGDRAGSSGSAADAKGGPVEATGATRPACGAQDVAGGPFVRSRAGDTVRWTGR